MSDKCQLQPKIDSYFITLLKNLIHVPAVVGYEHIGIPHVMQMLEGLPASVDEHQNVYLVPDGWDDATRKIMICAHIDEIGLQVRHVDDDGFLRLSCLGGIDPVHVTGQHVTVYGQACQLPGVIGRTAPHNMKYEDENKVDPDQLWADFGYFDQDDARPLNELVQQGDPVRLNSNLVKLHEDVFAGRPIDDRLGCAIAIQTFKSLNYIDLGNETRVAIVLSSREEIGHRGAQIATQKLKPHFGIAIDTTGATDHPTVDKTLHGNIIMGNGPVLCVGPENDHRLVNGMRESAAALGINVQYESTGSSTGTDAHAMQVVENGVRTLAMCIPIRYMHSSVETFAMRDALATISILCETFQRFDSIV